MAEIKPLIDREEIKTNIMGKSFSDLPHEFYAVYDEINDEFIIKVIEPERFVSTYHITDNIAVLVDPESLEVVGVQLFNFQKEYVPNTAQLEWNEETAKYFSTYRKTSYVPKKKRISISLPKKRGGKQNLAQIEEERKKLVDIVFA